MATTAPQETRSHPGEPRGPHRLLAGDGAQDRGGAAQAFTTDGGGVGAAPRGRPGRVARPPPTGAQWAGRGRRGAPRHDQIARRQWLGRTCPETTARPPDQPASLAHHVYWAR